MRRREAYAEVAAREAPPTAPIRVIWSEPPLAKPGHCPRCGQHFGRKLREHALTCPQPPGHIFRPQR